MLHDDQNDDCNASSRTWCRSRSKRRESRSVVHGSPDFQLNGGQTEEGQLVQMQPIGASHSGSNILASFRYDIIQIFPTLVLLLHFSVHEELTFL